MSLSCKGAWRATVLAVILALPAACGPAGMIAHSAVKEHQVQTAGDLERAVRQQYDATPALRDVKLSIAINTVWQNAFQTRYSVLLAGTVPSATARQDAIDTLRRVIGGDAEAIAVIDTMRTAPATAE